MPSSEQHRRGTGNYREPYRLLSSGIMPAYTTCPRFRIVLRPMSSIQEFRPGSSRTDF
jgi:hypothetical protein